MKSFPEIVHGFMTHFTITMGLAVVGGVGASIAFDCIKLVAILF